MTEAEAAAAAADIIDLYRRHASAWVRDRGDALTVESGWLERFRALLPQRARVLDLGCGAGTPIGRTLIEAGHAVTGIDAVPDLVALAQARFPGATWQVADMRGLDLRRVFDGVLAWDSVFHLAHDDQRTMFPVFARHAAPGALLMFTSGPAHGVAIGRYRGDPLFHASLAPEEYRALLAANGFEVLAHRADDPDCGRHTVWLARRR